MSAYENVVGGKLKLKGKALDVKAGGVKKKKKHKKKQEDDDHISLQVDHTSEVSGGESRGDIEGYEDGGKKNDEEGGKEGGGGLEDVDELLTPAERRYIDQRERIDVKRLAKTANKSHRDRIQDFNQYLANMSEHYDIPKVGPG